MKKIIKQNTKNNIKGNTKQNIRENLKNPERKNYGIKHAAQYMRRQVLQKGKSMGREGMKREAGIDGILVTVGLCVIALLLCVVMKDSLATFITTIVNELTLQAKNILGGTGA